MEDIFSDIIKGIFRLLGYILAELFFWFICYYTGWPFCKIMTFGRYPSERTTNDWHNSRGSGVWCALLGLAIWITSGLFLIGVFG